MNSHEEQEAQQVAQEEEVEEFLKALAGISQGLTQLNNSILDIIFSIHKRVEKVEEVIQEKEGVGRHAE